MRKRWGGFAAVVFGYLGLSLIATWPLMLHFHTHTPGSEWWGARRIFFDTPGNLWNLWWFRHALVELRQSPFQSQYIFYPHGANLWYHALAPLHGLLGLFLQSVFSLAATQNVLLLTNLVASGGFTYLLARHLGVAGPGAFIAGAVYAFSPGIFAHLYVGHFELLSTFWMPAGLLVFLRLTDGPAPRWREGVLLGLVFVGAAYTSQYYVVYGAELILLAAIVHWRRTARAVALKPLGLCLVVTLVGVAPILWALLSPDALEPFRSTTLDFDWFSGDVASFLVPSFTHAFLSGPLRGLHDRLYVIPIEPDNHLFLASPQERTLFLGFAALGLALYALARRHRIEPSVKLAFAIALVFGVLSLGAHLKVYGIDTGFPLPAGLLAHVPLLRVARAPGRHIVLVMLGMGILAGMGWQEVRRGVIRWGLLGLLALEYAAFPIPLFSTEVPEVYHRLAKEPGPFAILEVPFGLGDGLTFFGRLNATQIFAQTVHGHPVVRGVVSRLERWRWRAILASPVIGTLLDPEGITPQHLEKDVATAPAYFARWRIQAVIIYPQARGGVEQRYLERVLPVRAREEYADGFQLLWIGDKS